MVTTLTANIDSNLQVGMHHNTWGQLVSTTLNHKTCINTSRQVLEKLWRIASFLKPCPKVFIQVI